MSQGTRQSERAAAEAKAGFEYAKYHSSAIGVLALVPAALVPIHPTDS